MTENAPPGKTYLRTILDAFPLPVLITDVHLRIHNASRAARKFFFRGGEQTFHPRLCGDFIRCVHARASEGGCGTTAFCPDCVMRQTAEAVLDGHQVFRRASSMKLERDGAVETFWFMVTGAPFEYEHHKRVILTLEDITEILDLRRIIPICSHCRKVRDDARFWRSVEDYFHRYTGTRFSHGICPDCLLRYYPDMVEEGIDENDSSGNKPKIRRHEPLTATDSSDVQRSAGTGNMTNPIRQKAVIGLSEGDRFRYERVFTQTETLQFGEMTHDYNPVHYDERWSDAKGFSGLICHGLLVGSMICEFGGQVGWLASGMNFKFIKPVYFGDRILCDVTITRIAPGGRSEAEAVFTNQHGEQVGFARLTGLLPQESERVLLKRMIDEGDPDNNLSGVRYDL